MSSRRWKRPKSVSIPQIYYRFDVQKDGKVCKMRVQDMTSDRFEEIWQLYEKHFYPDEIVSMALNIIHDPESMRNEKETFLEYVSENVSYVVVLDDSSDKPQIVGAQILRIAFKDDQKSTEAKKLGQAREKLDKMFEKLQRGVNVFEELNVDHYFTDRGFVIVPQFRGLKIAEHMFKAIPIMAAILGVPAMSVVWSSPKLQKLALRVGFNIRNELIYEEEKDIPIAVKGAKSVIYTLIKW